MRAAALPALALIGVLSSAAAPITGTVTGKPVSCISVSRILDTDPIDDRTILFFMKGRQVYRNDLDNRCRTVTRTNVAISYRVSGDRLCSTDIIRLFDPAGGIAYGSCSLGKFTPYEPPEGVTRDSQ